jgi:hypothetical protein
MVNYFLKYDSVEFTIVDSMGILKSTASTTSIGSPPDVLQFVNDLGNQDLEIQGSSPAFFEPRTNTYLVAGDAIVNCTDFDIDYEPAGIVNGVNDGFGVGFTVVDNGGVLELDFPSVSGVECPIEGSVICFVKDTQIVTSNGLKEIQNITSQDKINGVQVHSIVTSIVSKNTDQLVMIAKDALGKNKPDKDTTCTVFHMILDGDDWKQAHQLVNGTTVTRFSSPENTRVYNILLADKSWGTMVANNLVTESLHPENEAAKKIYAKSQVISQ